MWLGGVEERTAPSTPDTLDTDMVAISGANNVMISPCRLAPIEQIWNDTAIFLEVPRDSSST